MTDTAAPPTRPAELLDRVVIRFAGDSGDGMQLTGDRFTTVSAAFGNDLSTLPDFPAEIRAPAGTVMGVSSFQVHISDHDITTPGDECDVLVAMNPAALRGRSRPPEARRHAHRQHRHLRRAQPGQGRVRPPTPSTDGSLAAYKVIEVPMTSLTKEATVPLGVKPRDADRSKNFFALGLVSWLYSRPTEHTLAVDRGALRGNNPLVRDANRAAYLAGLQLRRDHRAVRPPLRGEAGTAAGRACTRTSPATPRWRGGSSPPASSPTCRCCSAATRSRRRRTSSTSCRSTRTSACARSRPKTRSRPAARRSAPPSPATSASPRRAAPVWPSRARR